MTHRLLNQLLQASLIFTLALSSSSGHQLCEVRADEPNKNSQTLKLQDFKWTSGFWYQRQVNLQQKALPAMTTIMQGKEHSHFLENFRIANGSAEGRHRGPGWNDGDTYKWIEALAATYAWSHDESILKVLDEAIFEVVKAQRADGYLHTPVLIDALYKKNEDLAFGNPGSFEMYNFGHLMTAGCVHHQATGKRELLDAAIKIADFLDRTFTKPDDQLARHAICPAHYMGLVDLYRTTGEKKYLLILERLLQMRDLVRDGGDDNQDRVPFRQQKEAVGHAVRANYLYAGIADYYLEQGDKSLIDPLRNCWESVSQKKLYITGGCGALYDGASPDGSEQQKSITRIHQAYGRNYQLPNSTAHNETCAAIGYILWNYRMWQIEGDYKYIDELERSLYNAVLAGISLDGEKFFYTNTLRQLDEMPVDLRWPRERQSWISCYCCPPNVLRILAEVGQYAYAVQQDKLSVLLYGSNTLKTTLPDGQIISLSQESNYPWDGTIKLTFNEIPDKEFGIQLRIPGWCENFRLQYKDYDETTESDGSGEITITKAWKPGDTITLILEMPAKLMEAHPLVEECRGQVAVQRGPVVYCLESPDLPAGTKVMDAQLMLKNPWKPVSVDSLPGITALEGQILMRLHINEPTEKLYQQTGKQFFNLHQVRLIPYFAWGNRGKSEMNVWIPLSTLRN